MTGPRAQLGLWERSRAGRAVEPARWRASAAVWVRAGGRQTAAVFDGGPISVQLCFDTNMRKNTFFFSNPQHVSAQLKPFGSKCLRGAFNCCNTSQDDSDVQHRECKVNEQIRHRTSEGLQCQARLPGTTPGLSAGLALLGDDAGP